MIRNVMVVVNVLEGTLDVSARGLESVAQGPLELLVKTPQSRKVRFPVAIPLRNHVVSAESVQSAQSGGSVTVVLALNDVAAATVSGRRDAAPVVVIDRSVDVTSALIVDLDVVSKEKARVVNSSTIDESASLVNEDHAMPTGPRARGETPDLNRAVARGGIVRTADQTIVLTVVRIEETNAPVGDRP